MSSFLTALADPKIFLVVQELLFDISNCLFVDWFFYDLCVFKIYDGLLFAFPTYDLYSEHDMSFGGSNDNAIVSSRSLPNKFSAVLGFNDLVPRDFAFLDRQDKPCVRLTHTRMFTTEPDLFFVWYV